MATTFEQMLQEIDCIGFCRQLGQDAKKFDLRKPCCGFTLSNGILLIAIMDVIGGVLGVLPLVIWLVAMTVFKDLMNNIRDDLTLQPMESAKTVDKSFSVFLSVLCMVCSVCLLEFYLAMLLLNATKKKKLTCCYLYWRLVVVVLLIVLFVFGCIILPAYLVPICILGSIVLIYKIYCFWVVKAFVSRIGIRDTPSHHHHDHDLDSLPTVCGENEEFTKL